MEFSSAAESLTENGYAIIEDFLSKEDINDLMQRMAEIVRHVNPEEHQTVFSTTTQVITDYLINSADRISFFFEEKALDSKGRLTVDKEFSINKIGHALHCQDPVFSRITQSDKVKVSLVTQGDKVKRLVKALDYVDPVICQSMYIFKQPKIGGEVMPHQDSTFINTNPKRLVGLWIPLQDATKDNSCLWVIPGSHKDGVHNNKYMVRNPDDNPDQPKLIFSGPKVDYEDCDFVAVEMKAGSLLLLDGELVHKSAPNTSPRSRHAYTFHVFDQANCQYSQDNWLQPTARGTFTHLFAQT